jgi:WD40 repeat protein
MQYATTACGVNSLTRPPPRPLTSLAVWDMKSRACVQTFSSSRDGGTDASTSHTAQVLRVAMSPVNAASGSPLLASASRDHTVRVWDAGARYDQVVSLEGHRDEAVTVTWLPDGRLASAGDDGTVRVWGPV